MILLPIFLLGLSEAFWLTNNYDRDNSALSKKASILPDSSTSVLNDYGLVARKVLELWKKSGILETTCLAGHRARIWTTLLIYLGKSKGASKTRTFDINF